MIVNKSAVRLFLLPLYLLPCLIWGAMTPARAAEGVEIEVCYNYGCAAVAAVRFSRLELDEVLLELQRSETADEERAALARVLGQLYLRAAAQSPIGNDRAGNFLDDGVDGRMDCIDHSSTTTRLLEMLAGEGGLRFHRVLEPARRSRFIFQHFSAVIETLAPEAGEAQLEPGAVSFEIGDGLLVHNTAAASAPRHASYAVDSWFVNNGEAAVVLPLAEWLDGGGPNVQ